jgi:hypothetical protein
MDSNFNYIDRRYETILTNEIWNRFVKKGSGVTDSVKKLTQSYLNDLGLSDSQQNWFPFFRLYVSDEKKWTLSKIKYGFLY